MKIFSVSVELCAFCLVRGLIPSGFVKWNHGLIGKFTYKNQSALAGVAQWIEIWPVNQRVASSIPGQDIYLGCEPGPQEGAHEWQLHIDVSLPLFLPPFPSLKINK